MPPIPSGGPSPDPLDRVGTRLAVALQRPLPHHALSALMLRLTRVRFRPWKNWQIGWFSRRYPVDLAEATSASPQDYPCFNAFFTRALRPGSRTVSAQTNAIASPCDGRVSQLGRVDAGTLVQAKGRHFTVEALLGGDPERARPFAHGAFATVYLAPHDYHRVHMPSAGRLMEMVHVPGRLFSVNAATTRHLPDLYTRNERVVSIFDTAHGPMAVVLVGALFVGCIEQVWSGPVRSPGTRPTVWRYSADDGPRLAAGDEMGRFNMGSTVVLVHANPSVRWDPSVTEQRAVRMGERLGVIGEG